MRLHETLSQLLQKYATKRKDKNTTTTAKKKNEHEKIEKVFVEFLNSPNINTTLQAKCLFFFSWKTKTCTVRAFA